MITHILWDWNGTLLNDVCVSLSVTNGMLCARGLELMDHKGYQEKFGFPIRSYYQNIGFDFEKESFDEIAKEYIAKYQPQSMMCSLQEDAFEVLQVIKQRGIVQVLLSASQQENLMEQVTGQGIADLFDTVLGLSNIHAASKVEIGSVYLQREGIDPKNVLLVGDTLHDDEVARALGCQCALVAIGHHDAARLEKTGRVVLATLPEVLGLL